MVWREEGRGNILVLLLFRDLIEKTGVEQQMKWEQIQVSTVSQKPGEYRISKGRKSSNIIYVPFVPKMVDGTKPWRNIRQSQTKEQFKN